MNYKSFFLYGVIGLTLYGMIYIARGEDTFTSEWQGLEQMMDAQEFEEAGLGKLSKEELDALDQWLMKFLAHDSTLVVQQDEAIQILQSQPIRRQIPGHFSGWEGKTLFTLDNGEVWRQRMPGRYVISLEDPEVEIARNLLGYYELKVVKTGRRVGVTRVK